MPEETQVQEQTQTTPPPSFHRRLVQGLLQLVNVDCSKVDSFDSDVVPAGGVVTAEVTKVEQANPGLPDYFVSVSILGMTQASEDPDKEVIRTLFDGALSSYRALTSTTLAACFPDAAKVLGILPVTNAAIREGAEQFMFTVDFKIVVTNLIF